MAVAKIPGKVGVYRHLQTGFVVHEVWNLDGIVKANGFLIEESSTGVWIWMAGRDMRDYLAANNIVSLAGIAEFAKLQAFSSMRGFKVGARMQLLRFPTPETKTRQWDRIYAVYNALDCGYGQSEGVGAAQGDTQLNGYTGGIRGGITGFLMQPGAVGSAIATVPTGFTWGQHLEQFLKGAADGNEGRAEVQTRLAKVRTLVSAAMRARGIKPEDHAFFPICLHLYSSGVVRYVPPQMNFRSNSNYDNINIPHQMARNFGGRAYDGQGRGITLLPLVSSTTMSAVGVYSQPDNQSGMTDWSAAKMMAVLDGFRKITHVDDVPVERFLGGLSGNRLTDKGESIDAKRDVLSSRSVLSSILGTVLVGPSSLPARGTSAGGVPHTDEEFGAALEAQYASVVDNDLSTIILNNYDTIGFGFGLLTVLCAAAFEPKKAKRGTMMAFDVAGGLPPALANANTKTLALPVGAAMDLFPEEAA